MIKTINIISFTICNFIAVTFFSQDLQLSFSEHVPYESNYKAIRCINYNSKHLLFQSKKKSKNCDIKVNVFDEDFKNKNQFNFYIDNEKLVGVRLLFNNIVLFTTLNNGVETVLRTRILDVSSKFLAPKNIFSESNKSGYPSFFKLADEAFDDSFNVLVELPFQNGKNEDIKLITLDNSLQVINEVYNKLEIKFESKRDNRLLISNNGKIYLLKKTWNRGNNFYLYSLGKQIINEKEIKLSQRKIAALDFFFNSKDELVLSGFYSSPVRYNYEGFFLLKYDSDLQLIHKNQYALSEKIIKSFKSSKEIKESGFGLDKFIITDFSLDESQNHYLLAEHISKVNSKKETYWLSKGFIIIKFNKNGNYIWGCPVPKDQKDENFNFIGTFALKINNSNQYFFNELSNLSSRKGIPVEYGILNYCGTKNITFSESGISHEKPMSINFPGKDSEKYAFIPKQINPKNKESSYFLIINEKATNLMVGLVK